MSANVPRSTPQAARSTVLAALQKRWAADRPGEPFPDTVLGGVRGYYFRTMGRPDANDIGIYDDAIFVISPHAFAAFNANTDPSADRTGVATLLPGCHPYRLGNHGISRPGGGYPAFRPATRGEALPVRRHGESRVPSARPGIAINIHKGSYHSTSSLGCQTIYPSQWDAFYHLAKNQMHRARIRTIWYVLIDGPIN